MKCPVCGSVFDSSKLLIPGVEILRCRSCGSFRIDGDDVVILDGPAALDELRQRSNDFLSDKRHQEMVESDSDDPRWESSVL